jgi:hypothetical protein
MTTGSGQGLAEVSWEHGNEPLDFIKGVSFFNS